ncbi:MAG TPA: nucleotidyltransferase domain-containing protein [Natronosporangium sp.]
MVAVALGGSRATGTHRPDSDFDLGLYYRQPLDTAALRKLAADPAGELAALQQQTRGYPAPLRQALIGNARWEAPFILACHPRLRPEGGGCATRRAPWPPPARSRPRRPTSLPARLPAGAPGQAPIAAFTFAAAAASFSLVPPAASATRVSASVIAARKPLSWSGPFAARIACDSVSAASTPCSISCGEPFGSCGIPPPRRTSRTSGASANAFEPAKLSFTMSRIPGSALDTR